MAKTILNLNETAERVVFEIKSYTKVRNKELNVNLAMALALELINSTCPTKIELLINKHNKQND